MIIMSYESLTIDNVYNLKECRHFFLFPADDVAFLVSKERLAFRDMTDRCPHGGMVDNQVSLDDFTAVIWKIWKAIDHPWSVGLNDGSGQQYPGLE